MATTSGPSSLQPSSYWKEGSGSLRLSGGCVGASPNDVTETPPTDTPPSDSCKMSPQRQTVWHYLPNHRKMESGKKKTSLIHEGKNSLEGLTRKGLLESQLTYKNVSRTLRFPCSHHTGNGQMKHVLFWWMLGESLWICDDGIE
ncbi:hypothetical protein Q8A67_018614 [Cirrhinus molitorella]|uniref:Uncharacterized protein n=1 Tax=Cirrhinus molitorella TaxID=172907 RepID=A0AA88PGM1_9TELE|nr:hypothetical protein Q8A67_018614 [Cirrhinus molitorella]